MTTTRRPWYPSNGTECMCILDPYCAECAHEPICEILTCFMVGEVDNPEQWTAEDIFGRGFKCSEFSEFKRPVQDCGHVANDGTCCHPKNLDPICHASVCPCTLPRQKEQLEEDWKTWHELQNQQASGETK